MKDSMLTIRLPMATRRKVEDFAGREARSLSQAAERLIELGLEASRGGASPVAESTSGWKGEVAPIAGTLAGGIAPTLDDFRDARRELSSALAKRTRDHAKPRR